MNINSKLRLVEIVGPAGAGKTTLCHELSRASDQICLRNFPDVRKRGNAPFFIQNGFQLAPKILCSLRLGSRFINRREFAWLTILKGWPDILQKEMNEHKKLIVLDQGPIYLLTELQEFGPDHLKSSVTETMWQALYREWASTLDAIVWLDAPNENLMERIHNRDKEHVVKNISAEATVELFTRYRKAYERIISNLSAYQPDLKILRFDTSEETPDQIVNQLLDI